ncbi:uncharacterized protein SETTUDRAFT_31473 [Exserohilum turcica Et28A]|uniref:Uncharacterized protein n=1 Tax=Exserohilum turcicum (strain 28A) TaxID=671987 RepID=R0KGN3_EXST2|nr:uncharacterized protein SETTUDRAFT_31473 [Exserohilum turcica Et28A]EOA87182.1 hypothetical protein SETTUDRAFT_31473 [Exserohilum turcica Et28A]
MLVLLLEVVVVVVLLLLLRRIVIRILLLLRLRPCPARRLTVSRICPPDRLPHWAVLRAIGWLHGPAPLHLDTTPTSDHVHMPSPSSLLLIDCMPASTPSSFALTLASLSSGCPHDSHRRYDCTPSAIAPAARLTTISVSCARHAVFDAHGVSCALLILTTAAKTLPVKRRVAQEAACYAFALVHCM